MPIFPAIVLKLWDLLIYFGEITGAQPVVGVVDVVVVHVTIAVRVPHVRVTTIEVVRRQRPAQKGSNQFNSITLL